MIVTIRIQIKIDIDETEIIKIIENTEKRTEDTIDVRIGIENMIDVDTNLLDYYSPSLLFNSPLFLRDFRSEHPPTNSPFT